MRRTEKCTFIVLEMNEDILNELKRKHILDENGMVNKGKAIPVTSREGPYGCETSRLPHFLENRLTYGGEVLSPTRRPSFTPRDIPGTHFC
jgi:hypothetical protein